MTPQPMIVRFSNRFLCTCLWKAMPCFHNLFVQAEAVQVSACTKLHSCVWPDVVYEHQLCGLFYY